MKKLFLSFLPVLLFVSFSPAQQTNETAKENFKKYLDSKLFTEYAAKSLPALAECKMIFKGANADSAFAAMQEMKTKMGPGASSEIFVDVRAESFTTEDMLDGKPGSYTGGMKDIAEKINPKITFYKITYLRTAGAENGMAYNNWVFINKRWIFLPKAWRAFKSN
jgi:hypothetical protein